MEEVDQIILHSLKNIGCEFVDGMDSLKQMNTENVIEGTVKCLRIINPELKMSHMFPPGMSARFRVGTSIAQECKNVGYTGSLGYQTFLYSSEVDIRKIFMFLVEKLPRKEGVEEETGSDSVLNKRIGQVLRERCSKSWLPFYCNLREKCCILFQTEKCQIPTYDKKRDGNSDVQFIHEQNENKSKLTPTLFELNVHRISNNIEQAAKNVLEPGEEKLDLSFWHQPNVIKQEIITDLNLFSSTFEDVILSNTLQYHQSLDSRFLNAKKLQFTKGDPDLSLQWSKNHMIVKSSELKSENLDEDNKDKGDLNSSLVNGDITTEEVGEDLKDSALVEEEQFAQEEEALLEAIEATKIKQENFKKQFKMAQTSIQQMKLEITALEDTNKSLKEKISIKGKTVQLLPNAKENIQKLQDMVQSNKERLIGLAKMWEERKSPMVAEIEALREKSTVSEDDVDRRMEEIKISRRRIKETSEETKKKEQTIKQLKAELESMTQNISRQSYTRRILEIVASIHKQQDEIQRVIKDINKVQKTMNQQRGRIDRTFTAADELMFKDAKTDDGVRQAYKYMVALHDSCNALLETVADTGNIIREIRELEDQVDIELSKNAEQNFKKIAKDYKEMKKENSELMKQIKSQN